MGNTRVTVNIANSNGETTHYLVSVICNTALTDIMPLRKLQVNRASYV